jgi:hypothetical protein
MSRRVEIEPNAGRAQGQGRIREDPKYGPFSQLDTSRNLTTAAQTIPVSEFKAGAVPLHVTVTRTSPAIEDNNNGAVDPGFLGVVALQPCTFTTGSYGWKGGKRLVIDVVNPISDEKKTVQVMLT